MPDSLLGTWHVILLIPLITKLDVVKAVNKIKF